MKYTPEDGFPYYFNLVKNTECLSLFAEPNTLAFLNSIGEKKAMHRYAPGKWSIKQVLGHITDHEKIKSYRAFLLSRKQQVELWSYDQNALVNNSRFDSLSWEHLIKDYTNVRQTSLSFIQGLSESQLKIKGMARQYEVTLENFLKSIIGHEMHHATIIKERYL